MTRYSIPVHVHTDGIRELRLALTALLLLFVGLKLGTDGPVSRWPWWAVLLPVLVPVAVALLACVAAIIVGLVAGVRIVLEQRRQRRAEAAIVGTQLVESSAYVRRPTPTTVVTPRTPLDRYLASEGLELVYVQTADEWLIREAANPEGPILVVTRREVEEVIASTPYGSHHEAMVALIHEGRSS